LFIEKASNMQSNGKDLRGSTISRAAAGGRLLAGGTGDNTEIVGPAINLGALAARPASVVFEVFGRAVLAATATLVITAEVEQSVDGTTWSTTDLVPSAVVLTLTGGAGGSTEIGVGRMGADLIADGANFIRIKMTPNLSAANTDTAEVTAVAVFSGLSKT
jgi:hypothetical protein